MTSIKTFVITARVVVDPSKPHAVDLEHCRLAVEDVLCTPDNAHFGIRSIVVTGYEETVINPKGAA